MTISFHNSLKYKKILIIFAFENWLILYIQMNQQKFIKGTLEKFIYQLKSLLMLSYILSLLILVSVLLVSKY
jgi:hypothetical protein